MILVFLAGCKKQTISDTKILSGFYNLHKVRLTIDSLDKQFSKDFYNGDSVALANYYSSDAKFGSLKGK